MLIITSVIVKRTVGLWTMIMRKVCFADPNYFESEIPFLDEDIQNLPKPSEESV
jgi:hypothetical protein